jgi:ADP-ribosylglycohydrolase
VAAARGSLLGLVLGDAIGATAGLVPERGPLPATPGGQLACFTVDGLIRADVRAAHRGVAHPPSVVWHAYGRWAAMQGLVTTNAEGGDRPNDRWPDGWLADVAVLAEQRGSAPATLAALRQRAPETADEPAARTSLGPRAVTRTLPAGLYARAGQAAQLAADIAALTHRDEAVLAAALGATTMQLLSEGAALDTALTTAEEYVARLGQGLAPIEPSRAVADARTAPADSARLIDFAAGSTAVSALAGGLYVVASFPGPDTVRDALLFAASADDSGHAATVAGALLGAAHGPDSLPVGWVSRLELVWVADTLARDLVRQLAETPAGTEYAEATDPHWWDRYPGW